MYYNTVEVSLERLIFTECPFAIYFLNSILNKNPRIIKFTFSVTNVYFSTPLLKILLISEHKHG